MLQTTVRRLGHHDAPTISAAFRSLGWPGKSVEQYREYARQDELGQRTCFLAEVDDVFAGYCTLLWEAGYPQFRDAGIPEVSDLNVLPHFRHQGVGNRLMDAVEAVASERSQSVGLGVGLYRDYGAAQRLYVRRGYVPDGRGIMYGNRPVEPGAEVPIDDDAMLMLVLAF